MNVSRVDVEKFRTVCHWWESHGFPIMLWDKMPGIGLYVSDDDGRGICAAWLYRSDTWLAWLEYVVRNPEQPKDVTDPALDLVINELAKLAKELGFGILLTCTNKDSLGTRFERNAFTKTDSNVSHYVRRL